MPVRPDYRKLRLSNITSPEFSHLLLLLFWPMWMILFQWLESRDDVNYTVIECELDGMIPFCEYFLIPYLFWFVLLYL